MSLKIRPLCPELVAKAESELSEDPARLAEDLAALKEWLKKQPHLISRTDDQFLVSFLRGCKFSLQKAKEKLDMFYTIRTAVPEFYSDRDPSSPKLQAVLKEGLTLPLPGTENPDSPQIFLIRNGAYDPSKLHINEVMKVSYMITDLLLTENDNLIVSGQIIFCDLKGLSLAHLGHFSPTLLKKMATCIQESYPVRQKGIHFLHPPTGFDTFFNIFKSLMSEKARSRLFIHQNIEDLHAYIPKRLLPTEYGGEAGSIQSIADYWKNRLVQSRDFFMEDATYGTDESKRAGKPKSSQTLFGVDGSFRRLDID